MSAVKLGDPHVCVSIVSHRHGEELFQLVKNLELFCLSYVSLVIVTLNVPEPVLLERLNSGIWRFHLILIQNPLAQGFGANHNAAFKKSQTKYFCVLNPDIDFKNDPFPALMAGFERASVGCTFPVQMNEVGKVQDYAREIPSPVALLRRYMKHGSQRRGSLQPDWANGAFLVFRSQLFRELGGFDERYFMYCEDVDICLRLQLTGYKLLQTDASVVHGAQRNSQINFQHLAWHVRSLLRLWFSDAYVTYRKSLNNN